MMDDHKLYDTIQAYLNGELEGDELAHFENKLTTDDSLRLEVNAHKEALSVTQFDYLKSMKSKLDNADVQYKKKQSVKNKIVVASILVGVVLAGFVYNQSSSNNEADQIIEVINEPIVETVNTPAPSVLLDSNTTVESVDAKVLEPVVVKIETAQVPVHFIEDSIVQPMQEDVSLGALNTVSTKKQNPIKGQEKENVIPQFKVKEVECVRPKIDVRVSKTSADESNGELTVLTTSSSSYSYQLQELGEDYITYNQFSDLSSGVYSLVLKDEKGCEYKMGQYEVEESPCSQKKDYAFNLQYEESWEVPTGVSSSVQIITQSGKLVFTSSDNNDEPIQWDGTDLTYQKVPVGIYKVIIKTSIGEACVYNVIIEK